MKKIALILVSVLFLMSCHTNNNGTVTVVPLAPTNLTGSVASTSQINLSWTDNATNEDGYKIERKTGTGNYAVVGSTGANITTFSDMGLTANTTYTYRVYAHNNAGNSLQYSNDVTLTTGGLPILTTTTASSVTATNSLSGGEITDDGGSNVTARGVVWGTAANPTVSLSTKTTDGSGTGIFSSNINGLNANTTYYVRAYATNSTGTGYGNEITFTTNNIDITTGLVGYWPFNGNANDESGNGNNGTVNGATLTTDRNGENKAYYFNGNSKILVNNSNSLIVGSNQTISLWVKVNSLQNNLNCIMQKGTGGGCVTTGYYVAYDGSGSVFHKTFNYGQNSSACGSIGDYSNYDTLWHNITFVYSPPNNRMYFDGLSAGNGFNCTNCTVTNSTNDLIIGSRNEPIGYNWNGKLDDIRIYNRALTAEEVSYLYAH